MECNLSLFNNRHRKKQIMKNLLLAGIVTLALTGIANAQVGGSTSTTQVPGAVGAKFGKKITTASTNATNFKTNAGAVWGYQIISTSATPMFVKFYDVGGAAPTCNTDVPTWTVPVAAGNVTTQYIDFRPNVAMGFVNGIGICVTGAVADNDNTNGATGMVVNVMWK